MNTTKMTAICNCPFCHKETSVVVEMKDFFDWHNGKLAQDAFPYLSATERESLISGMCPSCQDFIFGDPFSDSE